MRHALPMIVSLLYCAPACFAQTSKAMEFHKLRESSDCTDLAFSALAIAQGRDNGIEKKKVVDQYKPYKDPDSVAKQVVDDIYDFPKLRPQDFAKYWQWECVARTNGIPIGTLKSVAPQLAECPLEATFREACLLPIRNQLLGLPRDYVPAKAPTTAIMEVTPR
jgi:hypothetical protein